MREAKWRLGEILIKRDLITEEQLNKALAKQAESGEPVGKLLVKMGFISEQTLLSVLAEQLGLECVDLTECKIDLGAVAMIPETVCKRNVVLPIGFDDSRLLVATADPTDVFIFDDLRMMTGFEIKPVVTTRGDILNAIQRYARTEGVVEEAIEEMEAETPRGKEEVERLAEMGEEAPIVKLANLLIHQAVEDRASDIHIEPQEKDIRVRYRIDGVLHEVMRPPKRIQPGLLSRLKIMSDMNIAERRVPQDGRIGLVVGDKAIDFRVATLPTVYGEQIVLRILEKESILLKLEDLGFLPETLERYKTSFTKPYGTILVTGPTGSGKSTTLYATLNVLNTMEKNITTIEDPVEYRLAGINQIQVNTKAGLTFAASLRSVLRSDPDILLIGEIRDRETSMIAVESALTGHLVLSTLHTNDAPSAITRLIEMGVEPFLVASALDCVLAQRLARRLCSKCKEAYEISSNDLLRYGFAVEKGKKYTFYRPKGCGKCKDTGYKGRMAIFEVMRMSPEIEKLTVERKSSDDIARQAIKEGMKTLRQDGFEKVALGLTSLEEILRVVA